MIGVVGSSGVDEEILLARAYLLRVAEPPSPRLAHLVDLLGPVEAVERLRSGVDLGPHVGAEVAGRRDPHDVGAADLAAVRDLGGRLLVPEDPGWPAAAVDALARPGPDPHTDVVPPLGLYVRGPGDLAAHLTADHRSVAVVGSRAATEYGTWVARDWSARLADAGYAIVSGAALGVDGAAHRGCLAAGGATVAVLACGVERAYPAAHTRMLAAIAERGVVVSEYPVGTVPARHRFLVRNRLIAALGAGTLLVEAGVRSGAARTVSIARELARPVVVVPGPVTSALSLGSHRVAREPWAVLAGSVEDVRAEIGPVGADAPRAPGPRRPLDGLSSAAVRVHGALRGLVAQTVRSLARESGVAPTAVAGALEELADAGLVEHEGERGWRRPGDRDRRYGQPA